LEHVERPRLGEGATAHRQPAQVAQHDIALVERLLREKRADVDADEEPCGARVPHERASTAAAEIDCAICPIEREELLEHIVANLRSEYWRRHRGVPRVGVELMVEVFRLLRELRARPEIEVTAAVLEDTAAARADHAVARALERPAAIRALD